MSIAGVFTYLSNYPLLPETFVAIEENIGKKKTIVDYISEYGKACQLLHNAVVNGAVLRTGTNFFLNWNVVVTPDTLVKDDIKGLIHTYRVNHSCNMKYCLESSIVTLHHLDADIYYEHICASFKNISDEDKKLLSNYIDEQKTKNTNSIANTISYAINKLKQRRGKLSVGKKSLYFLGEPGVMKISNDIFQKWGQESYDYIEGSDGLVKINCDFKEFFAKYNTKIKSLSFTVQDIMRLTTDNPHDEKTIKIKKTKITMSDDDSIKDDKQKKKSKKKSTTDIKQKKKSKKKFIIDVKEEDYNKSKKEFTTVIKGEDDNKSKKESQTIKKEELEKFKKERAEFEMMKAEFNKEKKELDQLKIKFGAELTKFNHTKTEFNKEKQEFNKLKVELDTEIIKFGHMKSTFKCDMSKAETKLKDSKKKKKKIKKNASMFEYDFIRELYDWGIIEGELMRQYGFDSKLPESHEALLTIIHYKHNVVANPKDEKSRSEINGKIVELLYILHQAEKVDIRHS